MLIPGKWIGEGEFKNGNAGKAKRLGRASWGNRCAVGHRIVAKTANTIT